MLDMLASTVEGGETKKKTTTPQVSFQTSLLVSEIHCPQQAHADYDLKTDHASKYLIAFLPLTETGQFLQLWRNEQEENVGELVFIPRGHIMLVPGGTMHGGGFRADHRTDNKHAHMRLHFYVYPNERTCVFDKGAHKNDYVATKKRYLHNPQLVERTEEMEAGTLTSSLGNSFFHGYTV